MKKVLLFVLMVMLCAGTARAEGSKTAYANPMKILETYQKSKDYKDAMDKLQETKAKELKLEDKKNEIMDMQKQYDLLKEDEQKKMKEKIVKAVEGFREAQGKFEEAITKENEKRMKEVLADVEKAINDYGRKQGYDMILDSAAVLYSTKTSADVTDEILDSLNSAYSSSRSSGAGSSKESPKPSSKK